jgi:HEAT repeat protein
VREALRLHAQEGRSAEDERERAKILTQRVQALKSLADLKAALLLEGWRTVDSQGLPPIPGDQKAEAALAQRFIDASRDGLQGSPARQLAVLTMLGQVGTMMTAEKPMGIGRALAADLIASIKKKETRTEVRAAAARSLGRILPDPNQAIPALRSLLESGTPAERQAAVQGLTSLAVWERFLEPVEERPVRPPPKVELPEIVQASALALAVVPRGLGDADASVRRLTAVLVRQSAQNLFSYLPNLPSMLQPDRDALLKGPEMLETRQRWLPVVKALNVSVGRLRDLLQDPDAPVRLAGDQALESIASVRQRLLQITPRGADGKPVEDPLRDALRGAVPALARHLSHREVRFKLAALYVLELLEDEAEAARDALVGTLQDADDLVRWGAVRVLGRMPAPKKPDAVRRLGSLLKDVDQDVRKATAFALERYGSAAAPALEAMRQAVHNSPDAETRWCVIQALAVLDKAGVAAIPELVEAISDRDAEVRVAAVRALGSYGSAALVAEKALIALLEDRDSKVRRAACDALLRITE